MKKLKKQNGITLIALIITIIVMLILVGVSVTVALNGGLFSTAQKAKTDTQLEKDKEYALSGGEVEIGGLVYASPEDYVDGNGKGTLANGWVKVPETSSPSGWNSKVVAIVSESEIDEETGELEENAKILPMPEGYSMLTDTIEEGIVITDGENEFVWIPVDAKNFTNSYPTTNPKEPVEITEPIYDEMEWDKIIFSAVDSQGVLDHYYKGVNYTYPETAAEKANLNNTFAYNAHYAEMVTSVNKYGGFYIGRYETTIDGSKVGSKKDATVLSADMQIAQTNNKQVRWWGLYAVQRNSNVKGNGSVVQTNMISGQQWDAMLAFFDSKSINYDVPTELESISLESKQVSGKKYVEANISDVIYNIYDLRGNVEEWTTEWLGDSDYGRVDRGGYYGWIMSAENKFYSYAPWYDFSSSGSRMALYIK